MTVRVTLDLEDGTYNKFSYKCIDLRKTKSEVLRWFIGSWIKTGSWMHGN